MSHFFPESYRTVLCCDTVYLVLYNGILTFETVPRVTIQMKATEQYFPVVLFIMLYKVVLTFESVNKILNCDHSNESY